MIKAQTLVWRDPSTLKTREENPTHNVYYIKIARGHNTHIRGTMIPEGAVYGHFRHWANGWTYFIIDDYAQFERRAVVDGELTKYHWRTMKSEQGEDRFYNRVFDCDVNLHGEKYVREEFNFRVLLKFMADNKLSTETKCVRFISRDEQEARQRAQEARIRRAEQEEKSDLEFCRTDVIRKGHKNKLKHKPSDTNKGQIDLDQWERVVCHIKSNFKTTYKES